MARTIRTLFLLSLAGAFLAPLLAPAQLPPPDAAGSGYPPPAPLPQDKLDALLAPIALYPDQLLGQVLMAATYPLEVVEAARFADQNRELKGEALEDALKDKTWDPSVISLASFPQVLAMMNDKLEWTQQLGDAFLANEAQVMQTVQTLRQKAQAAGNLQTTQQQQVVVKDNYIYVEPAQPQTVYVPVYNPTVVYGTWWWPNYRPWYWYPPPYYPPVVVQPQPQVYVQQAPAPPSAPPGDWYYCESAGGYYPQVQSCPEPWVRVPPRNP